MCQFAPIDIYTPIDNDTPPHSMTIFAIKTSANCSKAAKFAEICRSFHPRKIPTIRYNQPTLRPSLPSSLPSSLSPSLPPSLRWTTKVPSRPPPPLIRGEAHHSLKSCLTASLASQTTASLCKKETRSEFTTSTNFVASLKYWQTAHVLK